MPVISPLFSDNFLAVSTILANIIAVLCISTGSIIPFGTLNSIVFCLPSAIHCKFIDFVLPENVTKLNLKDPLHIYTEKFESFIIYVCIEGAASIQVPAVDADGKEYMDNYEFTKGETVLVPAETESVTFTPEGSMKLITSYIR